MPLDISIPTTSTSEGPKPFTKYAIRIAAPLRTTILHKRYSDFAALHSLLTSQVGTAPPAPLPGKSWLGGLGRLGLGSTNGSPEMIEERRKGLEAYLRAIESSEDGRWRVSDAWRKFMELGAASAGRNGSVSTNASGLGKDAIKDGSDWLDAHAELKNRLQEARLWLTKREQANTANAQHEAGANAKRSLVRAGTLIQALEQALERLSGKGGSEWGGERLGDGEVRRRRDLIGTARKEKDGLEGVLNAMAVKSVASSTQGSTSSASATSEQKSSLFKGAAGGGRRVLGAPAKETERTRELDNEGVLQLQKQIMEEQEEDVKDLSQVVRRMREMGVQINEEVVLQNQMLGLFEEDVDRVDGKIRIARQRADKIK
ncbi:Phox-like protein [Lophium mytilinum]|uniref:Phox-like protein n=1 Tax=Lophium mytilinum TaxID=390894 RepID=A0A6A6RG38_9PEZI|nr:Phox-like protein [Lophium mytilinum]